MQTDIDSNQTFRGEVHCSMYVSFCAMFCVSESEILDVRLLRKSQQVSRLDSICFVRVERQDSCVQILSLISAVKSSPIVSCYNIVVNCCLVAFCFASLMICQVFLRWLFKSKGLLPLVLGGSAAGPREVEPRQLQLRSFHVRFSAMLIIKSQC